MSRNDEIIHLPKRVQILTDIPKKFLVRSTHYLTKSLAIILLFVLWEVIPRLGIVEVAFFPPLSTVLLGWWELITTGQLVQHITASLIRSTIGFVIAIIVAIPLGLTIGWFKPFSDLANPVLEAFRNTAALAILPVFILLLGIGEASKIAVVIYACTFPILLSTISAVRNVDPLFIKSAKSMALNPVKLFLKVILPAAVPTIFVGIRLAASSSILVLVAAEMIGAKAGLGYLIISSQQNFQISYMYSGILTISALGMFVNTILLHLEKRLSRWKVHH
jgi:NitT/TauT family transport system permease protein